MPSSEQHQPAAAPINISSRRSRRSSCCGFGTSISAAGGSSRGGCWAAACGAVVLLAHVVLLAQLAHAASDFGVGSSGGGLLPPWQAPPPLDLAAADRLTLVFPLMPLSREPSFPPAYNRSQMHDWSFRGGPGLLLVTRHLVAPFTILSELFYMPGLYQAPCGLTVPPMYSTQRVWVDMEISRDLGRSVWGFPKEMAAFEWGKRSVAVRDTGGNIIFAAGLSDSYLLGGAVPAWLSAVAQGSITTVQWPIPGAAGGGGVSQESSKRLAATAATSATAAAAAVPMRVVPNVQKMRFEPERLFLTRATTASADSVAFTGRKQAMEFMPRVPVGVILGSPGVLSLPQPLRC